VMVGIVECTNFAIGSAHNNRFAVSNTPGEIVASFGKFTRVPGEKPVAVENRLEIGAKDFLIIVEWLRERKSALALGQQRKNAI